MALTAKNSGGTSYDPVSEGLHHAVCYGLYDLGTQYNETFGKSNHRVLVVWEIPDERIQLEKDGRTLDLPRSISKEYTLSLHEKSVLRKDLEGWRGKAFTDAELDGFDLTKLLGANCMLQVIHKRKGENTYANVSNVVQLMRGSNKKAPENGTRYFSFEEHDRIPDETPEWIKNKILAAEEWQQMRGEYDRGEPDVPYSDTPAPQDDDIPF